MKILEHNHHVTFNDIPEFLIKFCRETICPWHLIMLHLEDCRFNLLLTKWDCQHSIFFLSYLGYIICSIRLQGKGRLLRFLEKAFIELCDVGFEVFLSLNHHVVTIQGENSLLPMFAISNHLEVFHVIISQEDICYFGLLIHIDFLFPEQFW
jgi:hypothetical protein